ncbi:MAG TPA: pilus assembly protein TadG-related protein [Terriglobales bacterium]|nr:pilus assembly protein TadG-related protein [Terriglobales bacterium]
MITLVAVVMLFVVGAMAALSIDVVTFYTARSEAQLAADGAALAAARVLANSGATSDPTGTLLASVETPTTGIATTVAVQVAVQNQVGGTNVAASQVAVGFGGTYTNPTVTIVVQVLNLPTFFARIWGTKSIAVSASATAEAYNPSGAYASPTGTTIPVAPVCVKPWLLPNVSPNPGAANPQIFDSASGAILDTNLLGWETPAAPGNTHLKTRCSGGTKDCLPASANTPAAWQYYPGTTDPATGSFPAPSAASVACTGCVGFNNYQLSIAGCVQTPISCYSSAPPAQIINIDTTSDANRDVETGGAVNGMTNASANGWADSVDTVAPSPPFQFVAGLGNPIPGLAGNTMMVSESLVTVPVIDAVPATWPPATYPQVQIIGFVQLFLNPYGDPSANGHIRTEVINLVGCGTGAAGQPILGNGASPVAVRLISP